MSFNILKESTVNKPPKDAPKTPVEEKGKASTDTGATVSQVAFDLKMTSIEARLDNSKLLLIGLIIVMVAGFITLLYGYFSFASTSYNDYSQKVKELNDERIQLLQNRINKLENLQITIPSPATLK